jgi:hypothetical protein
MFNEIKRERGALELSARLGGVIAKRRRGPKVVAHGYRHVQP